MSASEHSRTHSKVRQRHTVAGACLSCASNAALKLHWFLHRIGLQAPTLNEPANRPQTVAHRLWPTVHSAQCPVRTVQNSAQNGASHAGVQQRALLQANLWLLIDSNAASPAAKLPSCSNWAWPQDVALAEIRRRPVLLSWAFVWQLYPRQRNNWRHAKQHTNSSSSSAKANGSNSTVLVERLKHLKHWLVHSLSTGMAVRPQQAANTQQSSNNKELIFHQSPSAAGGERPTRAHGGQLAGSNTRRLAQQTHVGAHPSLRWLLMPQC